MSSGEKINCSLCAFRNPRATATAVIARGREVLLAKRTEEPFKGWWDLIGGYLNEAETPEKALRREIMEELGVECNSVKFMDFFPGYASWKGTEFPILSSAFLVDLDFSKVKPNKEIAELKWFHLDNLPPIAFDSNEKIINYIKTNQNSLGC